MKGAKKLIKQNNIVSTSGEAESVKKSECLFIVNMVDNIKSRFENSEF